MDDKEYGIEDVQNSPLSVSPNSNSPSAEEKPAIQPNAECVPNTSAIGLKLPETVNRRSNRCRSNSVATEDLKNSPLNTSPNSIYLLDEEESAIELNPECIPNTSAVYLPLNLDETHRSSVGPAMKRKRNTLSIQQKVEILEKLHYGVSVSKLHKEYDIGHTTIYDLISRREKILKFYMECDSDEVLSKRKSLRGPQNSELETVLYQWYCQCQKDGLAVSGPMLMSKAKVLHSELKIEKNCHYSKGWLERFRKRHNICFSSCAEQTTLSMVPYSNNNVIRCVRKNVEKLFDADSYRNSAKCKSKRQKSIVAKLQPMTKRKRNMLTIQQKVEMLKKLDEGESVTNLRKEYDVGHSTIYDLKAQRYRILKFYSESDSVVGMAKRKTLHRAMNSELDKALYTWYRECRDRDGQVTGPMIIKRARELHIEMSIKKECDYSSGWLQKFKNRHGIRSTSSEGKSVKVENLTQCISENGTSSNDQVMESDMVLLHSIKEAVLCIAKAWNALNSPALKNAWKNAWPGTPDNSDETVSYNKAGEKAQSSAEVSEAVWCAKSLGIVVSELGDKDFGQWIKQQVNDSNSQSTDRIYAEESDPEISCESEEGTSKEISTLGGAIETVSRCITFLEHKSFISHDEIMHLHRLKYKLKTVKMDCDSTNMAMGFDGVETSDAEMFSDSTPASLLVDDTSASTSTP